MLCDTLRDADPDQPIWSWSSRKTASFAQRRMPIETALHRWDAENAAAIARPIQPPELAADGVDEFFDTIVADDFLGPGSETIALVSTDVPGWWRVSVEGGSITFVRAEGSSDATVRASVSDLLLLLWRRIAPFGLAFDGDQMILARFLGRADLD